MVLKKEGKKKGGGGSETEVNERAFSKLLHIGKIIGVLATWDLFWEFLAQS